LSSSDSSSDSEEIEYWYLPLFDTAGELRVASTRYIGQESESDLVTAVMIYESMESLDEPPPTISYRVEHLTAEPLTSDEEEETLVVSTAMDEAAGNDSVGRSGIRTARTGDQKAKILVVGTGGERL
jgi:hypothetical protein